MTPPEPAAPARTGSQEVAALLEPRSIAVLGASDRPGPGQRVVANLKAIGFSGELYLINPNRPRVAGAPTYPSVAAVDAVPDLVVAAVNRDATVRGIAEAAQLGCRAAVLLAAGFGESDRHGRHLDAQLGQAIGQMSVLGPNCLGYVNLLDRTAAYSGPLMEPPDPGVVALVTQSGALACTFTGAAAERGIRFSHVITTGNQVGLHLADYLRYLAQVQAVRVIACYLEGFTDGRALLVAMDEAIAADKAVIVLKGGRSRIGEAAALTHTGAMAGSARVQTNLWRQHGVLVAADPEEFLALIELCSAALPLSGPRTGIITISGGERLLIADAAEELGVPLAVLTAETASQLEAVLPDYAAVANPLDTTGAGVVDGDVTTHRRAAAVVSLDPGVDVVVACQDAKNGWIQADRASRLFRDCVVAAADAAAAAGKPLVVISPTTGGMDESARQYLNGRGIPLLTGMRPGMAALAQLIRQKFDRGSPATARPADHGLREGLSLGPAEGGIAVSGHAALARLTASGVTVWPTRLARSPEDATLTAQEFGYPIVMKLDAPGLLHRTDVGGVLTGLGSAQRVRSAWSQLIRAAAAAGIAADGVLIQPMAPNGTEIFVGGFRDEQFGPVIMCGAGGVLLELLADLAVGLAPLSEAGALELLKATRAFRLLNGFRGKPTSDMGALCATISAISEVVAQPDVLGLDVNPLVALPDGVALLDAKLIVAENTHWRAEPAH